ncbi:MAG: hypothetical protein E7648_01180 [Ruminococcaceae bacterium]|nr:hypothetical protein [Oscillospiraceae bacterium]
MKILILSCNTGEGHNSCARAIREEAEKRGDTVDVWDAMSFWSKATNKLIVDGQEFLYKNLPELFGAGYRFFEKISEKDNIKRQRGKNPGKGLSPLAKNPSERLHKAIAEGGYDIVICVHIFASLMVTEYRKNHGKEQPTFLVATDYTCSPGANSSDVEACFTPSEGLTDEFLSLGTKRELIVPVGIPVREDFYTKLDKNEAKSKLGLPLDKRIVLLMSGSMGCGPIKKTVLKTAKGLPDDCILVAICGKNQKLLSSLNAISKKRKNIVPVGFTKEIPTYMDASELIITKAGGLSSTEAGVKHLPIVFSNAIPGLETHNRDYFVSRGFAFYGETPDVISAVTNTVMASEALLSDMKARMAAEFTHRSAREIVDYVHENKTV